MQTKNYLLVVLFVALSASVLSAAPAPELVNTTTPAPASVVAGREAGLKRGMPADAVMKIMGKPAVIRPMEAPNGKAEVWVYVREISTRIDRVGFPSQDEITYIEHGVNKLRVAVTPGPILYHDVHFITEETIEVLMFNHHFLTQKVTKAERQLFQQ